MNYLVPGPVLDRMFNFLFDHPSATGGRLLADLQREAKGVTPPAPAAKPEPPDHQLEPYPGKAIPPRKRR